MGIKESIARAETIMWAGCPNYTGEYIREMLGPILYERAEREKNPGVAAYGGPERERQCLGEEANADLTKLLTATGTPACTVSRARRAGGIAAARQEEALVAAISAA